MRQGSPVESTPATHGEIEAAIQALTRTQLLRLESFAWFSHRALGSRGAGRNEGDLLSDAIIATLEGRRNGSRTSVTWVRLFSVGGSETSRRG